MVNASSEEGRLAVNGMSNAARDGEYSNGAIVMNVGPEDFGDGDVLAGMRFQRRLEEKAYETGKGKIPVMDYCSFKGAVCGEGKPVYAQEPGKSQLESMCKNAILGETEFGDLTGIFEPELNRAFVEGMDGFDKKMEGFASSNPLLAGVESRTSAPVRILRDEHFQSDSIRGIYPCGEGAGYAGGITSAAMDGLRVAEEVCEVLMAEGE